MPDAPSAQWSDPASVARAAQSVRQEVQERLTRLELPFNALGLDPFGISRRHLEYFFSFLGFFYRHYFRVKTFGAQHVPASGRAMLVGNHSGGIAVDGGMVIASAFLELDPPRLAQGMAEKFIARMPFAGEWTSRVGQFTGLPEQAVRLLEDDRLLMVFPEGARGTAKLYRERYSMVDFGTGFMRLALQTGSPIIPMGVLGGGAAVPTVTNLYRVGKLLGVPYLPVTPYLIPFPLPVSVEVHYGEPLRFEGTGDEEDHVVEGYVEVVKQRINELIQRRRQERWGPKRSAQ